MKLFEISERINLIHRLVYAESTGTPECFAQRLGISKRQLFNILDDLKLMGVPICYDVIQKTYRYSIHYHMSVNIKLEALGDEELKTVSGGYFCRSAMLLHPFRIIL